MLRAAFAPYRLLFNFRALTSRGALPYKDTYFIKVWHDAGPSRFGIGECAVFRGLSADDRPDYEEKISALCRSINRGEQYDITGWSSLRFGLETALADLDNGAARTLFPSAFSSGQSDVVINGLVWMGSLDEMTRRADEKIAAGFRCIKFKIGSHDFDSEVQLLERIRAKHGAEKLEIRLDANGAFTKDNVMQRLNRLAILDIHSIEQPVAAGQVDVMAQVCAQSPIAIAIDEELIGCRTKEQMAAMLKKIQPAYIILKPALCGGFSGAADWIECAGKMNIGWWATSALESNIGLNAIAQWTAAMNVAMPQGLGTGGLYTNNITSPLTLVGERLSTDPAKQWQIPELKWIIPE